MMVAMCTKKMMVAV